MIVALNKSRSYGNQLSQETREVLAAAVANLCKAFELAQREVGKNAVSLDLIYSKPEGPHSSFHVTVLDLGNRN